MRTGPMLVGSLVALLLLSGCATLQQDDPVGCEIAQRYIDAGNSSDATLLEPLLTQDVAAIFLSTETDHAETVSGRTDVLDAVRAYKEECPSCSSSMTCHLETESAVYVTEAVSYEDADGSRQQQNASLVFELDNNRIARIIYFPSN